MSRILTVLGTPYNYPDTGDTRWGDDASEWAQAVTDVVSTLAPPGFIPLTSFDVLDNVSSFADVEGALFDSTVVQSFAMRYSVTRSDGSVQYTESGVIEGVFNGTDWDYNINLIGDAQVEFQVTAGGQVQYTSSSLGGTYTGTMGFSATVLQV